MQGASCRNGQGPYNLKQKFHSKLQDEIPKAVLPLPPFGSTRDFVTAMQRAQLPENISTTAAMASNHACITGARACFSKGNPQTQQTHEATPKRQHRAAVEPRCFICKTQKPPETGTMRVVGFVGPVGLPARARRAPAPENPRGQRV